MNMNVSCVESHHRQSGVVFINGKKVVYVQLNSAYGPLFPSYLNRATAGTEIKQRQKTPCVFLHQFFNRL